MRGILGHEPLWRPDCHHLQRRQRGGAIQRGEGPGAAAGRKTGPRVCCLLPRTTVLLLSCQTLGRVIGTEAAGSAAVWVEPWDCIAPTQLRVYLDGELVGFSPIYYTY